MPRPSKIDRAYLALNLPAPVWCPDMRDAHGAALTWHRWAAIPGGHGGVWGWDRWCRNGPAPYCAPRDAPAEPPPGARACRRCRGGLPRWMDAPNMGDVFDGILGSVR